MNKLLFFKNQKNKKNHYSYFKYFIFNNFFTSKNERKKRNTCRN